MKSTTGQCLPPRLVCARLCLLSAEGSGQNWSWPPSGAGLEGSGRTALQPNQSQRFELSHPSCQTFLQRLRLHPFHLCLLSQLAAWHFPAAHCSLLHRQDKLTGGCEIRHKLNSLTFLIPMLWISAHMLFNQLLQHSVAMWSSLRPHFSQTESHWT